MSQPPTDILIIGAGPIGLAHAWGLKKLNPHLNIKILEKYPTYQRKHVLNMKPASLEALMKVVDAMKDPQLSSLLKKLKKRRYIRTSELESIFKKCVFEQGVEIVYEEVNEQNIQYYLLKYQPKLVIGADGTHSVVNKALFPKGNQIKLEFDYVLQLRYDIQGQSKVFPISLIDFYQEMTRQGLIANEYVGAVVDGKMPVTLQLIISKKAFTQLKALTSKKPMMPYAADPAQFKKNELSLADMPEDIRHFLLRYWEHRLKALSHDANEHNIDVNSIRISVNESPATYAQKACQLSQNNAPAIVLAGDAVLGLSYFKGANAGFVSTAHFLSLLKPVIGRSIGTLNPVLKQYEHWMLNIFGPKKIKEVAHYSAYRIRIFQKIVKWAKAVKQLSKVEYGVELPELIADYFHLLASYSPKKVAFYPHRKYPLVKIGQIENVPFAHSWLKIKKGFKDYFKPYKSRTQIAQDFKQPLIGMSTFFIGLFKIGRGCFSFNLTEIKEGVGSLLRGFIDVITTPLAWLVKPLMRTGFTLAHHGFSKIEENAGIKKLVKLGIEKLNNLSVNQMNEAFVEYELLSLSTDLHRKFMKAIKSGQYTSDMQKESILFNKIRESKEEVDKTELKGALEQYFLLFQAKKPLKKEVKSSPRAVLRG